MDTRTKNDTLSTADREMVITRIVDAPRELVWEAMTNPEHVAFTTGAVFAASAALLGAVQLRAKLQAGAQAKEAAMAS